MLKKSSNKSPTKGIRVSPDARTAIFGFFQSNKSRLNNPSHAARVIAEELQDAASVGPQTLAKLARQAGIQGRQRGKGKAGKKETVGAGTGKGRGKGAAAAPDDGVEERPDLKQTLRQWNKQFDAVVKSLIDEENKITKLQSGLDAAKRMVADIMGMDAKGLEGRLAERRK